MTYSLCELVRQQPCCHYIALGTHVRQPLGVTDDVVCMTHGSGCEGGKMRYLPFLQHTLFVCWADPESLTEAVMMSLAGLNSSCTVVVTVHDENNNPPVFSQHEVRKHMFKQTHTHTHTCDVTVCTGHDKQYHRKKKTGQTSQAIVRGYWTVGCESAQRVTDLIFLAGNQICPLISGLQRWHHVTGGVLFSSLYSKWTVFLEFNLIKLSLESSFHSFIHSHSQGYTLMPLMCCKNQCSHRCYSLTETSVSAGSLFLTGMTLHKKALKVTPQTKHFNHTSRA